MYQVFKNIGNSGANTDDKKYPCVSVPYTVQFMPYQSEIPSYYRNPKNKTPLTKSSNHIKILPQEPRDDNDIYYSALEMFKNPEPASEQQNDDFLLPVLDCRFNLREICKQSILLEDHLSHDKKRCFDCCIKHFLALEGLSEEAITLDKNQQHLHDFKDVPDKIREIQKFWFQDPQKNSHRASQMLREIRKKYMQKTFNVVFENNDKNKDNMCEGGLCKIKK